MIFLLDEKSYFPISYIQLAFEAFEWEKRKWIWLKIPRSKQEIWFDENDISVNIYDTTCLLSSL